MNCLILHIDDPSQAMMFILRFGGEIIPPEDIDSEWKNS
jgi:hypothetical protein